MSEQESIDVNKIKESLAKRKEEIKDKARRIERELEKSRNSLREI